MEPKSTTWYEIVGCWQPRIQKRLVSTETAAYVFHPNGRKSLKKSTRGLDWHPKFDDAKIEIIRRANEDIEKATTALSQAQTRLANVQNITEESTS